MKSRLFSIAVVLLLLGVMVFFFFHSDDSGISYVLTKDSSPVSSRFTFSSSSEISAFAVSSDPQSLLLIVHNQGRSFSFLTLTSLEVVATFSGFKRIQKVAFSDTRDEFYIYDAQAQRLFRYNFSESLSSRSLKLIDSSSHPSYETLLSFAVDDFSLVDPSIFLGLENATSGLIRYVVGSSSHALSFNLSSLRPDSLVVDPFLRQLYVTDFTKPFIWRYSSNGIFLQNFSSVASSALPLHLGFYACGEDGGYIFATRDSLVSVFHRGTSEYLGSFHFSDLSTSSIISFSVVQRPSERFPFGAFYILTSDFRLLGYDFRDITSKTRMSLCEFPVYAQFNTLVKNLEVLHDASGQIRLTWEVQDQSRVTGYVIYRNGIRIGTSKVASYLDAPSFATTSLSYQVAPIDDLGLVMPKSQPALISSRNSISYLLQPTKTYSSILSRELMPKIQIISPYEVRVSWETRQAASGQVFYGFEPQLLNVHDSRSVHVKNHEISLTGLKPNTTYYYRVRSVDILGRVFESDVRMFTTASLREDAEDITPPVISLTKKSVLVPKMNGYKSSFFVTLATNEAAQIYFTTDETDPRHSDSRMLYAAGISVLQTTLIRYYALDLKGNESSGSELIVVSEDSTYDTDAYSDTSSTVAHQLLSPAEPIDQEYIYDDLTNGKEYGVAVYEAELPEDSLLFVSHYSTAKVEVWNLASSRVTQLISGFTRPYQIAVESKGGFLYVADRGDYTIKQFRIADIREGKIAPSYVFRGDLGEPIGIGAYHDAGGSYLIALLRGSTSTRMMRFESSGKALASFGDVSSALEFVLPDPLNRRIFVTDRESNALRIYGFDGRYVSQFGSDVFSGDPKGLDFYACGSDGYLLVVDQAADEIEVFHRKSLSHLATFRVAHLDSGVGLVILDSYHPKFSQGAVFIVTQSKFVESLNWQHVAASLGASVCVRY